jgi:hypothetical protein
MSGTGKSTVIGEFRSRRSRAVALDYDEYSHWADGDDVAAQALPPAASHWVWTVRDSCLCGGASASDIVRLLGGV